MRLHEREPLLLIDSPDEEWDGPKPSDHYPDCDAYGEEPEDACTCASLLRRDMAIDQAIDEAMERR